MSHTRRRPRGTKLEESVELAQGVYARTVLGTARGDVTGQVRHTPPSCAPTCTLNVYDRLLLLDLLLSGQKVV